MTHAAKPTGMAISRKNNELTLTWKRKKKPTAQQLQWRRYFNNHWGSWTSKSVGASDTSAKLTITTSNYFPTTDVVLGAIEFKVRGKKGSWSSWSSKAINFSHPDEPTVTQELSDTYSNVTNFTWAAEAEETDDKPYADIEWQAVLQEGYNEENIKSIDNWSALSDYDSGTSVTKSYTHALTEISAHIADGSHTRWFRCRTRGWGGPSEWAYTKHVYAKPYQSVLKSVKAIDLTSGNILTSLNWTVDEKNSAFPIDDVIVQYAMAVPDSNLTYPTGTSPTDADVSADAGQTGAATFETSGNLDADEVLFVRVNTKHDRTTTDGVWKIAKFGKLATPENLSVSTNNTTYKATVTVTNKSTVPDSFMVVRYCPTSNPNGLILGIIPNGSSSVIVQCPNWSAETAIAFKVYAVQGTYTTTSLGGGITEYRINANMESESLSQGGSIPVAPTNVSVNPTDISGTVQVRWAWSWSGANGAEISWADHADAWESTEEPDTHEVTNMDSSKLNISDLETGKTWYIRVRLFEDTGDAKTYGAYSDIQSIDLSSAPLTPLLRLSSGVITTEGMTTATWAFVSGDGTSQTYAEICEATYVSNVLTYGNIIASTQTAQHIDIYAKDTGWTAGTVHYLCLRVQSGSGKFSDTWSPPVPVIIAEPLTCSITATSLVTSTVVVDGQTITVNTLDELPLTVTVSGAGSTSHVTVAVERATDYFLERPDESQFVGYKGETVALTERQGNGTVTIDQSNILGMFDDGADYRIVATINDELGQAATDTLDFIVGWDHQALMPTATIALNNDVMEITPVAPIGVDQDDTCDIYRLSADRPQLVYQGAEFGTKYIDPYPTIGDYGGYRIVFKSKYGDYITQDGELAWEDYGKTEGVYFYTPKAIINFGDDTAAVMLDMALSNQWEKDFQETKYLGGSVRGDWNPSVSRKGTVNSTTIRFLDEETISALHRLAAYPGICHVRMPDGTNIHANVDVTLDSDFGNSPKTTETSLSITRVDSNTLDGMTYSEWSA